MQMKEMREVVSLAYPGFGWRQRVQSMPPNQVAAIYRKLVAEQVKELELIRQLGGYYKQMDLFEYYGISI